MSGTLEHTPFAACLFDAYGTLFDVNSAARALSDRIGPRWAELSRIWRTRQLEYTWLRSLMGRHADFRAVTAEALDYAFSSLGQAPAPGLPERLMDLYMTPEAYPEVAETLAVLRARGVATAILSNGSPDMLAAATASAGLTGLLDACLSVEAAGIFKPAPAAYRLGCERFDAPPERIVFASSNGWDIAGAATFGFHAVWINRDNAPSERLPGCPAAELDSLARLPEVIESVR